MASNPYPVKFKTQGRIGIKSPEELGPYTSQSNADTSNDLGWIGKGYLYPPHLRKHSQKGPENSLFYSDKNSTVDKVDIFVNLLIIENVNPMLPFHLVGKCKKHIGGANKQAKGVCRRKA